MLDYMSDMKRVILYEKIKSFDDIDAMHNQDEFFAKTYFYSTLRNEMINDNEYERVRKFWNLLQLQKHSDMNELYNLQNSIILFEVFENRA